MKTLTKLALLASTLTLTACHMIEVSGPNGQRGKVLSFGQRVSIGGFAWSTNGVTFTNYNLDQVTGIQAMSAAINSGIAAGAAAAVKAPVVP